jgi:LysR family hydrogen peroxide-inducible transcriptional activator
MEMHQLRYAVAVARAGNFSRAAEQCHVSQPSLSQQIQKLEEELGERLFERTKREARATRHGEAFLSRALRILEEVDALKREAEDAKNLVTGSVTIGVLPTIAPYLLPKAISAFAAKFPGVGMIVQEETTSRLLGLLNIHEVDVALISPPFPPGQLETRHLLTEDLLLALPPGHPLVQKRRIPASLLEGEQMILMKEGHCLGEQVLSFCNRSDLRPAVSFRSPQLETIQALVRAGMGISLIPAMACSSRGKTSPEYRRITPKPERTIVAAWPKQRPPGRAAAEFLNVLCTTITARSPRQ